MIGQGQRHHRSGDARDRSERQIDAPRQHDQELTEGNQRQRHRIDAQRVRVKSGEAALEPDQNGEKADKDQDGPIVAELEAVSARRRHPCLPA